MAPIMLKFNNAWRFHPRASTDHRVVNEFSDLILNEEAVGVKRDNALSDQSQRLTSPIVAQRQCEVM
jgi:hypothetical protein